MFPNPDPIHICLNGHVVPNEDGVERTKHCLQCGEVIVSQCQSCQKPLPIPDEFDIQPAAPAHCGHCGQAHEWTRRRKQAAIELFVEDVGDTDDAKTFASEIEHISRDTPNAKLAAVRINNLLAKIGTKTAALIRDLLVGVASSLIAEQLRSNK
ncbi:MAG: DUF2321 domain-containing protein [Pirellulaceae bacterium]